MTVYNTSPHLTSPHRNHNFILSTILILIASVIIGTVLMFVAYSLPVEPMRKNVAKSIDRLLKEDQNRTWIGWRPFGYSAIGSLTDSIMYNNATFINPENNSVIYNSMMNPRAKIIYDNEKNNTESTSNYLSLAVSLGEIKTNEQISIFEYPRYWHGYLTYLKPLFMLLNVQQIRFFNFFILSALTLAVILRFFYITNYKYTSALVVAFLIIDPVSAAISTFYSQMYYLTLIALVLITFKNNYFLKNSRYYYLFLFTGIITCYIDHLSSPLISLGIPITAYLIINSGSFNFKQNLFSTFILSFAWSVGYVGMWAGKWITAYLLTGNNVIQDALNRVSLRINGENATWKFVFSHIHDYLRVDSHIIPILFILCLLIIIIPILIFLTVKYKKYRISQIIPLIFISLYPFIWYAVVQNHSIIHSTARRLLSISIFAILSAVFKYNEKN